MVTLGCSFTAVGCSSSQTLTKPSSVSPTGSGRTTATVFSPNHVDYLPLVAGFLRAGGIVSPANPLYTEYELRGQIEKSKSTFLIAHPAMLETAMKAVKGTDIKKVIVLGDSDCGVAGAVPFDRYEPRSEATS